MNADGGAADRPKAGVRRATPIPRIATRTTRLRPGPAANDNAPPLAARLGTVFRIVLLGALVAAALHYALG